MSEPVYCFFHGGPMGGKCIYWERSRVYNVVAFPYQPRRELSCVFGESPSLRALRAWQVDYKLVADYGRAAHYNISEGEWIRLQEQSER